jgi:hypothetical protein
VIWLPAAVLPRELPEDDRPALQAAVSNALVRLSQLLTDLDEVTDVDLDPLHAEASGVVVLGARIGVEQTAGRRGHRRFAIGPYPKELEQHVDWQGRRLLIRPIRPEDESLLGELLNSLEPEDSRMRFFDSIKSLPRARLARFSQIDYDREMALVAIERGNDGASVRWARCGPWPIPAVRSRTLPSWSLRQSRARDLGGCCCNACSATAEAAASPNCAAKPWTATCACSVSHGASVSP